MSGLLHVLSCHCFMFLLVLFVSSCMLYMCHIMTLCDVARFESLVFVSGYKRKGFARVRGSLLTLKLNFLNAPLQWIDGLLAPRQPTGV